MWLRSTMQRRAIFFAHRAAHGLLEPVDVVRGLAHSLDVPAVRLESLRGIVAVGELGGAVDRDVVVVVHVDEATELEVAGERRRLVADALLEVAVARDDERVVADDVGAESSPQVALRDAHADAVREALTQRTGGDLDAGCLEALGMAGGLAAPLAELLQVLDLEPVAGEAEHRVQEDRRVAGRQHEPISVGPERVSRVVLHHPRPEDVSEGSERHRGARMTRVRALGRIHREASDDVDAELFDVGDGHASPLSWVRPTLQRAVSLGSMLAALGSMLAALGSLGEERERGGVAVQEVVASDRTELTGAEHPRQGAVPEGISDH